VLSFSIISRGRPAGLAALLEALDAQVRAASAVASIRVVLNQATDASYAAVFAAAAARSTDFAWRGCVDPGIPAARNALVAWLLEERPEACVFLDDDERPAADWLATLLRLRAAHPQTILTGPVLAAPAGAPSFLARHGAYDRVRRLASGASTNEAYTNNTLVPFAVLQALGPSFDRRFTQTGGSDAEWFRRAARAGFEIRYFPELVVHETVEEARAPLGPMLKRWLRNGTTDTLIRRQQRPGLGGVLRILGRGSARAAAGLGSALLLALLLQPRPMLRWLRLGFSGLGSLLGLLSISPRQY
jgi:hypothetical protein